MATEAEQLRKQLADALDTIKALRDCAKLDAARLEEQADEIATLKRKLAAATSNLNVTVQPVIATDPVPYKPVGQDELVAKVKRCSEQEMSDEPVHVYGLKDEHGHDFIVHKELKSEGQMTIAQVFGESQLRVELTQHEWFFLHLCILQALRDNDWRDEEKAFWDSRYPPEFAPDQAEAVSAEA